MLTVLIKSATHHLCLLLRCNVLSLLVSTLSSDNCFHLRCVASCLGSHLTVAHLKPFSHTVSTSNSGLIIILGRILNPSIKFYSFDMFPLIVIHLDALLNFSHVLLPLIAILHDLILSYFVLENAVKVFTHWHWGGSDSKAIV